MAGLVYIENEGALFRGIARAWPSEVWVDGKFVPYTGETPKGIEWGTVIDQAEADQWIAANGGA